MNIPKQFINILGAVVIVAILIAGIALVALPLYGQAQTTDASTKTVDQSNTVYDVQVTKLRADEARMPEISANVANLRKEIAARPQLDDVFEIVDAAAAASDASVVSIVASDPVAWSERTAVGVVPGEALPDPNATEAPSEDAAATAEADAGAEAEPAPEPTTATPVEIPAQQQVPVVISVDVEDPARATAFLDALADGARLIGIETSVLESEDGNFTLTVNALAFVRTEDN